MGKKKDSGPKPFKGNFKEGHKVFMTYQLATLEEEKAKKAEIDARRKIQITSTTTVMARREWERWMAVAPVEVVENVVNETLSKLGDT